MNPKDEPHDEPQTMNFACNACITPGVCTAWPTGSGGPTPTPQCGVRARPGAPGRDFDVLARALSGLPRGLPLTWWGAGGRLAGQPPQGYQIPAYVADMVALIARWASSRWTGSAPRWGLIGLALAAQPVVGGRPNPIRRRSNDVGPVKLAWIAAHPGLPRQGRRALSADEAGRGLSVGDLGRLWAAHAPVQWEALSARCWWNP